MKNYLYLMQRILDYGDVKDAARGLLPRTKELFSETLRFDLQEGFPLLTTKRIYTKGVIGELHSKKITGSGNPNFGRKWNDEQRKKMSIYRTNFFKTNVSKLKGKTLEEICGEEKGKKRKNQLRDLAKKRNGNKNPFFGKKHTEVTKNKIRNKKLGILPPNSKKVEYNHKIYESANKCALELKIPMVTVAYRCRKEIMGFRYKNE
jgi:thymidylate synthase